MQFAGALQRQKASRGVFITNSRFTDDARNYVTQIASKIVLIDGEHLTQLMIDHDVGVSTVSLYPVKKIVEIRSGLMVNSAGWRTASAAVRFDVD